jgi:mediator of replication checkpoint protein 1
MHIHGVKRDAFFHSSQSTVHTHKHAQELRSTNSSKMGAPLKTYGRVREASPGTSTESAPLSNSPLLSPNSRVKKLLADLGESSDEEEDVEQLRSKFLSKKEQKDQAAAESSPLMNRTRALNGKLPSKSIFDTAQDEQDTQEMDTQDDADGLVLSKPIEKVTEKVAFSDVDSMADTQPDFEETQPDEDNDIAADMTTGGESKTDFPSPMASPSLSLASPSPIPPPVATTAATNTTSATTRDAAPSARPRRNRVIADSDSEDDLRSSNLPSSTLDSNPHEGMGLKKTLSDLSDLSGSENESESEHGSEDESQQRVNALKERLASTVDELDPFEDADVSVISSQKPTRKASKKALEEIERENQRINRQRNLAPEVYTTGLVTKQNLLARFGMALKEEETNRESVIAAPTTPGKTATTSVPHSDDSVMDFDLLSSPLTSNDPGLQPQEVKEVPFTPSKMMPPSTPSLSRSVNKKQVKKLANVGVHRMASYITKRPSQLLSTLSDSDDDLIIVPDAEADKVPESFRKMQQQGVPVKYSSQKPAATAGPDFFSQMKANIRKQHAQMKADSERERQQLGLVDLTEQDKEDEAVESLLEQARRQQQEIADREKRERRRAHDEEYDSVAESDHEWFDNDDESRAGVPDSEDEDSDVNLSDEDGLQAQQALVDAVSGDKDEKAEGVAEDEVDTQLDFPEDTEVKDTAAPDSVDHIISGITATSPSSPVSEVASPVRDNTAYLRQLAEDEAAHQRRERARTSTSGLLDGEAEESDDDWAGLGGASDEETTRPEDLAEIGQMVDDTKTGADRENYAANRQYDLQKDLDDDAKQVEKLLDDVTNGGLRRKRANNLDLDFSDSEDEDEMRRKRRILSERKKKRMLEAGNLEDLAKNPEAAAFIRAMQDTDSEEEDEDVFALPTKPAALKREGPAQTKKKPSIQETLSFLCEESVEMPPSSPGGNSDMESDDDLIITGQTHSTIDLTASRQDTVMDDHDDEDYLERLGPSRNVVVREAEDDEELKTIIGPNGNFHGLIRKKKQPSMTTSSTESVSKKKNARYLQQQESETQKQQSLKNRFLAKFKSVGSKPKSQSYMKGGSFY